MITLPIILLLTIWNNIFQIPGAQAFVPVTPSLHRRHDSSRLTQQPLKAVIYGADGETVKEDSDSDGNDESTNDLPLHVLYGVQAEVDAATLARVACAFAPAEHSGIQLEDVKQAILVAVTKDRIDIALSLLASPDDSNQQLLQVLVPVPLEKSGSDNIKEIEKHIMEQIRQLDTKASKTLVTEKKEEEYTSASGPLFVISELKEEPSIDVQYAVDWWNPIPPLKTFLRDEAESFKKLLNSGNDFQVDLQKLARQQLQQEQDILRVQVASIGPSGMWLKAAILLNDGDEEATIMDVPIQFLNGKDAATADDLRESVLTLVESVEAVAEEKPDAKEETTPIDSEMDEGFIPVPAEEQEGKVSGPTSELSKEERTAKARQQPKSPEEEAKLAAKYAAIEDLGERAFAILVDLGMV